MYSLSRLIPLLVAFSIASAVAQESSPVPATSPVNEKQNFVPPSREELEKQLAAVAGNSDIADAVKPIIEKHYKDALKQLESANSFKELENQYRQSLESAPHQTRNHLAEVEKRVPRKPPLPKNLTELDKTLTAALTQYAEKSGRLESVQKELITNERLPTQTSQRLPAAREQLAQLDHEIRSINARDNSSPARSAEQSLLLARYAALEAEIAMLEMEQLSHAVRVAELDTRRDVLARETKELRHRIIALQDQKARLLEDESRQQLEDAQKIARETGSSTPEAVKLSDEVLNLSQEYEGVTRQTRKAFERRRRADRRLEQVETSLKHIRDQFELGGLQGSYIKLFQRSRDMSVNPHAFQSEIDRNREELANARVAAFTVREQLDLMELGEYAQTSDSGLRPIDRLVWEKREILEKLADRYRDLVRELVALVTAQEEIYSTDQKTRAFLREKLFWVKSSPPMSLRTFEGLADSWRAYFSRERCMEFLNVLTDLPARRPELFAVIMIALIGHFLFWKKIMDAIVANGEKTRRIASDSYLHTIKALLLTLVLALTFPFVMLSVGYLMLTHPESTIWLRGFAIILMAMAVAAYGLIFLAISSVRGGLCERHFGWDVAMLRRIRRGAWAILATVIPAGLIVGGSFFDSPTQFETVGRIVYISQELLLAGIFFRAFNPRDGIFAVITAHDPRTRAITLRRIVFLGVVGIPIVFAIMAAAGYLLTAITLSGTFRTTVFVAVAGFYLYALILRWFLIRERKIALAAAIERRRQRRKEASSPEVVSTATDQFEVEEAEANLNIEVIGEQTRRILILLTVTAVIVALYYLWSVQLSAMRVVDSVTILGSLSLGNLLRAILVGVITIIAARNLPGLLEVAILHPLVISHGTRKAVASLCQYGVVLAGMAVAFQFLHVDWSKFGWIAAALSVGIGFGLQEVVANFICGIILLFERPIRVGDTVTVHDIEGVVTRIQMRATTITSWDRKDFIVPNKELVTGTMMNWTLTSPITRVTISVGVAYGTDTAVARAILQKIAEAHPDVLDDPAPFTVFQDFGDSALMLELRIYLGDITRRISTYTAIRETIARRFADAGIEIAFPQRDLNIRGISREAREALMERSSQVFQPNT
jgi:potassium efflux system protein